MEKSIFLLIRTLLVNTSEYKQIQANINVKSCIRKGYALVGEWQNTRSIILGLRVQSLPLSPGEKKG
jgi:hypothetical protein